MRRALSKWFLVPAFAFSVGALGLAPGAAMAGGGACSGLIDPITLQIDVSSPSVRAGDTITVKGQVSNCSGAPWSGNISLSYKWATLDDPINQFTCTYALNASLPVQLKAGDDSGSVSFKARPLCFGQYEINGVASNSTTMAQASAFFSVGQHTHRH